MHIQLRANKHIITQVSRDGDSLCPLIGTRNGDGIDSVKLGVVRAITKNNRSNEQIENSLGDFSNESLDIYVIICYNI